MARASGPRARWYGPDRAHVGAGAGPGGAAAPARRVRLDGTGHHKSAQPRPPPPPTSRAHLATRPVPDHEQRGAVTPSTADPMRSGGLRPGCGYRVQVGDAITPDQTDPTADRSQTTGRNHTIAGVPGARPPGKIASPLPAKLIEDQRAGVSPSRGLAPAFLAAAPALLEPLHEAEPRRLVRGCGGGGPCPVAPTCAARGAPWARATAPPANDPAHVPPAGQRPHGTGEHDQEPADADWDDLRYHSGQEQAHADQEPDRRFDHPALVVDARDPARARTARASGSRNRAPVRSARADAARAQKAALRLP